MSREWMRLGAGRPVLASGSTARARLLRQAGLAVEVKPVAVDETAVIAALRDAGHPPRDMADALAELKALKASARDPEALVIAADQIVSCEGDILEKPGTVAAAGAQLRRLAGRRHELWSAACLARGGQIIWRHVGAARLWMRPMSEATIAAYLDAAGPDVLACAGGYQIEGLGAQVMTRIEGDQFTIEGLPLLPLLDALRTQGVLPE